MYAALARAAIASGVGEEGLRVRRGAVAVVGRPRRDDVPARGGARRDERQEEEKAEDQHGPIIASGGQTPVTGRLNPLSRSDSTR
jgi:hypothetical protein